MIVRFGSQFDSGIDLRVQDLVEYRKKIRPLRVKMMDGALKTVMVSMHTCMHALFEILGSISWQLFGKLLAG